MPDDKPDPGEELALERARASDKRSSAARAFKALASAIPGVSVAMAIGEAFGHGYDATFGPGTGEQADQAKQARLQAEIQAALRDLQQKLRAQGEDIEKLLERVQLLETLARTHAADLYHANDPVKETMLLAAMMSAALAEGSRRAGGAAIVRELAGISTAQARVLCVLGVQFASVNEIADRADISKHVVTSEIEGLIEKGLGRCDKARAGHENMRDFSLRQSYHFGITEYGVEVLIAAGVSPRGPSDSGVPEDQS
jgi:hypothetical protein